MKEGADLIEDTAETCGGDVLYESTQETGTLFNGV